MCRQWKSWCLAAMVLAGVAPLSAQPAQTKFTPSSEALDAMTSTVASLVRATHSDRGYLQAEGVVDSASKDLRLGRAWREWRRLALVSDDGDRLQLIPRGIEVTDYKPLRLAGGLAPFGATAKCLVHVDVAMVIAGKPEDEWPADPWQCEVVLQRADEAGAPWKVLEAPNLSSTIDLPDRGGDRVGEAIQVLLSPVKMLRAARIREDSASLKLLVSAISDYIGVHGKAPSQRCWGELVENTPPESREQLRRAFLVAGTDRKWRMRTGVVPNSRSSSPLLWDGLPERPYFLYGGQGLFAYANGQVMLRRPDELH